MTVVSYGCETWSLTLREEHRILLFKNRLWPKRRRKQGNVGKFKMKSFLVCITHQMLFG